jgi:UPF0716 protein FxsA
MLPLLLVVVFVVVPLAELFVLIEVGGQIGALPTVAILVADSVLGALLLRSQGRVAWRRFNQALAAGRPPAREVLDGGLIIFGGAFLITPGFLTDLAGLVLLVPPTRALVRRALVGHFSRRAVIGLAAANARRRSRPSAAPSQPYDVEGNAVEVERGRLER